MVFSKFDFSDNSGKITSRAPSKGKRKSDIPTGRNYKNLIEKVTRQKMKLETLEKVDKQKAKDLKEKVCR